MEASPSRKQSHLLQATTVQRILAGEVPLQEANILFIPEVVQQHRLISSTSW